MISAVPLLAMTQAVEEILEQTRVPKSALAQVLIVVGSLLVVTALIVAWVVFFRKKHRHHEHHWNNREARPAAKTLEQVRMPLWVVLRILYARDFRMRRELLDGIERYGNARRGGNVVKNQRPFEMSE